MKRATILVAVLSLAIELVGQTVNEKGMISMNAAFQYVNIPDSLELVPTSAMTIEAWFYLAAPVAGDPTIVRKSINFPSMSWLMRVLNGGTVLQSYITVNGDAGNLFTATVPSVVGAWHHMATTFDGVVSRMYLDGIQVAVDTTSGTITYNPGDLVIGRGFGTAEQWIGSIDEVRLWSVARTAAQIQADRFQELPPTPGLISAWRLNGNYLDSVGSHHGTPMGAIQNVVSTSPVVGAYLVAPSVVGLGSNVNYEIYASTAGAPYIFDISITGTSPGVPLPPPSTLTIPLNQPWIHYDFGAFFPPSTFSGFIGLIPPSHSVFPVLDLPTDPSLIGITIASAFALLDASAPSGVGFVSTPKNTVIGAIPPQVSDVTPDTVPVGGSAPIAITGSHFQPGATVTIDDVPATNVVVLSPSFITAVAPAGTLGPADVRVTNPDTLSAVLSAAITYVPTMVVSSISPALAPAGATITITGAGFVGGLQLAISGSPVTPSTVGPTAITFQVPATVPCNAVVSVINPDQQFGQINWNPAPIITQVFSNNGPAGGGGTMFLLGAFTPGTTVTIGGAPASVTFAPTALLIVAPAGSPGVQPVVVTASNGCTANTTYLYQ